MPKITKIVAQQSRSERVSVFADGKFVTGLDLLTWLKLGLKTGSELTPKLIAQLKEGDIQSKSYDKALKLLSFRPQSRYELKQKLSKRFPPAAISETLKRLTNEGLINDERFATIWVNERMLTRRRSIPHLIAELRQKGIERELIRSAISKLDKNAESAAAFELVQRRSNQDPEKLRAYLARKGFSYATIREVEEKLQLKE